MTEDFVRGEKLTRGHLLSDRVRDFIIEAIRAGEFKPGDRIVESSLARKLGVSQAPVREALRDLAFMGFLEIQPYKGASVRSLSFEELNEVYLLRAALESLAARQAAVHCTEQDLQRLEDLLEEMVAAGRDHNLSRTTQLDTEFHETIVKMSGNQLLYRLWQRLWFGFWTIVTARTSGANLEELALRHQDLLEALKTRDPETAMKAMKDHIEALGQPPETARYGNGAAKQRTGG
jgi:DNA-binding GntR family transcriptional regulator